MCQLWVNLPAAHKMTPPRYQPITQAQIPASPLYVSDGKSCTAAPPEHGNVRVIAGEFKGVRGPATTFTQVDMWDISLSSVNGAQYDFETVPGNNVIVFIRAGSVVVQGKRLGPQDVAILELGGSLVRMEAVEANSKVLLLAGQPIGEPIAHQGPFVMNTSAELNQAIRDYRSGNFGT